MLTRYNQFHLNTHLGLWNQFTGEGLYSKLELPSARGSGQGWVFLYPINLGVFPQGSCGGVLGILPLLQTTQSLYNHSESLVHIPGSKLDLFPVGSLRISSLVFEEKVVLLASSHLRGEQQADRWIGAVSAVIWTLQRSIMMKRERTMKTKMLEPAEVDACWVKCSGDVLPATLWQTWRNYISQLGCEHLSLNLDEQLEAAVRSGLLYLDCCHHQESWISSRNGWTDGWKDRWIDGWTEDALRAQIGSL